MIVPFGFEGVGAVCAIGSLMVVGEAAVLVALLPAAASQPLHTMV